LPSTDLEPVVLHGRFVASVASADGVTRVAEPAP
jgi:hypothetical protein